MNQRATLTTAQKALKINLNSDIYGTFAEIGAGQETVREFFSWCRLWHNCQGHERI